LAGNADFATSIIFPRYGLIFPFTASAMSPMVTNASDLSFDLRLEIKYAIVCWRNEALQERSIKLLTPILIYDHRWFIVAVLHYLK